MSPNLPAVIATTNCFGAEVKGIEIKALDDASFAFIKQAWLDAPPEALMTGTQAGTQAITIRVRVAAVPDATYQWLENGTPIRGATEATLTRTNVKPGDTSRYAVRVTNTSGSATSAPAVIISK